MADVPSAAKHSMADVPSAAKRSADCWPPTTYRLPSTVYRGSRFDGEQLGDRLAVVAVVAEDAIAAGGLRLVQGVVGPSQ